MADEKPSAYALLSVHPWAPGELITASYWWHAGELQRLRSVGYATDAALHGLTRAYELISEPNARAAYNEAIGFNGEPLTTRQLKYKRLPLTRRFILRQKQVLDVDYYEALGLSPSAPEAMIAEAARVMRSQYLRLPVGSTQRRELLRLLDEAISTLLNEERRAKYDISVASRFSELYADGATALDAMPTDEDHDGDVIEATSDTRAEGPESGHEAIIAEAAYSPQPATVEAEIEAARRPADEELQTEGPGEQPAVRITRARRKTRQRRKASAEASNEAGDAVPAPSLVVPESPVPVASSRAERDETAIQRSPWERASAIGTWLARVTAGAGRGAGRIWKRALSVLPRRERGRPPAVQAKHGQEPGRLIDARSVIFQRPLRPGDILVEEEFLRRLASSVRAAQPAPTPEALDVSQPQS